VFADPVLKAPGEERTDARTVIRIGRGCAGMGNIGRFGGGDALILPRSRQDGELGQEKLGRQAENGIDNHAPRRYKVDT